MFEAVERATRPPMTVLEAIMSHPARPAVAPYGDTAFLIYEMAVFTAAKAPNFGVCSCQRQPSSQPIWPSSLPPIARDVPV